jgi:hypothetical protein
MLGSQPVSRLYFCHVTVLCRAGLTCSSPRTSGNSYIANSRPKPRITTDWAPNGARISPDRRDEPCVEHALT